MCSIEWSKKDTSIFIELLKERNCLWQIKCKEYKNKVLRDMAIKAITEEMAKHIVGIGQDDIKKKINTLRTTSFFYFSLSGKQMQARRCAQLVYTLPTVSTSRLVVNCLMQPSLCSVDGSCVGDRVSWTKLTITSKDGIDSLNPA